MEEALVCADRPEPEILPGFGGGGGKCLLPSVFNPSLCTPGSPRCSQTDPGQVVFPDAKVLEHCSSGLCASQGPAACLPVSPPHLGIAKHYGLFYLFPLQAADLDGEIDLSTCYDVTEYPVQRNYGFQIHVRRMWGGRRVQMQDSRQGCSHCAAAWGCSSVARETFPQKPERPLGIPHNAPESCGLGFESQFFGSQKMGRGKG